MKIVDTMPEATILEELGRRARQQRIGMNFTQPLLADAAGVSARTVERFEAGASIQLDNLVRILRALRLSENLDMLVPAPVVRPLQMVGGQSGVRQRASTRKKAGQGAEAGWAWGDEK